MVPNRQIHLTTTRDCVLTLLVRLLCIRPGINNVSYVFKWPDIPHYVTSMPRLPPWLLRSKRVHDNVSLVFTRIIHRRFSIHRLPSLPTRLVCPAHQYI